MLLQKLKKVLRNSGLVVIDWDRTHYTITKKGYQGGGSCPELARIDKVTSVVSHITDAEGRFDILYTLQDML